MATFWMGNYSGETPKRHDLYSNSPGIAAFDVGKLRQRASMRRAPKTCVQYVDRQGRRRFKGTKHLKKTETLGYELQQVCLG